MFSLFADGSWSWLGPTLGLLAIPLLVALNAFFVAAEFSLVAVRKTRVEELITRGIKGARSVLFAVEHLDRSIAATQLGITLSSLGLGWVAEVALADALSGLFAGLPAPLSFIARHSVAGTIAFFLVTFLHVVFGELFPKSLALQSPDRIALWIAKPLILFELVTRPLVVLMNGTGNLFIRVLGIKAHPESLVHSVEELTLLIEDTEEAGVLDPDQAELVQNVFQLTTKSVADCMVPRDKVAALELTMPPDKILEAVRSGAHTRMPVYQGELDNIVGIVNTKDLFYLFSLRGVVVLEDALYQAIFLKPDEEIANALRLFKKAKRPMALVRDDDGKIHGLLTLEDILEEIIGDIEDEHDQPLPARKRLRRKLVKPPAAPPVKPSMTAPPAPR
ncbi:MAG: hemolysin family protein [Gemmataceae bacterium]|nr:hemolysin family protein [Gemmataceae bacterium]MCI0737638.1 hemolysin family protein [Gemmataceae bacterium]